MKKLILFISLITIIGYSNAEEFPAFPMTMYGNIETGNTPLNGGTIKIYNSSNEELTSYEITETGKYGSDNVSKLPLLLNEFSGNLIFKVSYEGNTYIVDKIDDSNKKDSCPDKSSITFISDNCRYDITLKQEMEENDSGETNTGNTNTGNISTGNTNTTQTSIGFSSGGSHKKSSKNENSKKTEPEHNAAINQSETQINTNIFENQQLQKNDNEILENGFSKELNKAYLFSYKNGITTKENIKDANLEGTLTRISAAKMLSLYAINVLGKEPDISKGILKFNDITNELNEKYDNAVTLAYQLGIMGINVDDYFRPHETITRAEFATALSRMLYGTKNGIDLYYTTHLNKLKQEGIIKDTNPNLKEKKGYSMLMLMRATKN